MPLTSNHVFYNRAYALALCSSVASAKGQHLVDDNDICIQHPLLGASFLLGRRQLAERRNDRENIAILLCLVDTSKWTEINDAAFPKTYCQIILKKANPSLKQVNSTPTHSRNCAAILQQSSSTSSVLR